MQSETPILPIEILVHIAVSDHGSSYREMLACEARVQSTAIPQFARFGPLCGRP